MPIWGSVITQIEECTGIDSTEIKHTMIQQLPLYENLLDEMKKINIDDEILQNSHHRILNICQQIQELSNG